MSYNDIADMAGNSYLKQRIAACAVTEGVTHISPMAWASVHQWYIVANPGWSDNWAYARAAQNPEPGRDEAVITDGMILSAVQPRVIAEAAARAAEEAESAAPES